MSGLKKAINLLKKEILEKKRKEIRINGNCLIYLLNEKEQKYDISSPTQGTLGELGRAYALLMLIDKFKIPPEKITREVASKVGSPSKRVDIKIDLSDEYKGRRCIALVEVKTSIHKISEKKFSTYFRRQLYNIAHAYVKDKKEKYPLILLACEVFVDVKQPSIKFSHYWFSYPEIEKFGETGQIPLDEIISRKSPLAYTTPPEVTKNNEVYFHKKPLKVKDLVEIRNPNELKKLLKEKLHQQLRNFGIVEDEAFETIMNLLLAKSFDEIRLINNPEGEPEFQVKANDYLNPHDFYNRIKKLLEDAYIQLLKEDPKTAKEREVLKHEKREKILLEIVPYLQRFKLRSLRFLGEDSVGDVFLDFMHSIFRQSRGLFFTHPNICRFVCKAVGIEKVKEYLKKGELKYILDPACGSGTFLIEALRLIFRDYDIEKIKDDATKILYGIDNESRAVALCKVNMVIHGDGSANIYERNALSPLSNLPFSFIKEDIILRFDKGVTTEMLKDGNGVDFIITNPPFSLEIKIEACGYFRMKDFVPFKNNTTTASECFFAERWFQLLNSDGRIGVVLPFALFDSKDYLRARLLFLCYFKIVAIVGLPEHAFSPHAQQRTVLVFAKKRNIEESNKLYKILVNDTIEKFIAEVKDEKIIFYNARDIGYVRIKKQKTVITYETEHNDLTDEIANIISNAFEGKIREHPKLNIKTLGEIRKERGLNLTPPEEISVTSGQTFTLEEKGWEIVEVEIKKPKPKEISEEDIENILLCETGDIVPGGAGIITPKKLSMTTTSNKVRIIKKLKNGNFGCLKEGDVIIAPVRVYQRKIAVLTKHATKFLFSKDFIVLRRKKLDLVESFSIFISLTSDENIKRLLQLSSTGKSGYPKIKNKEKLLKTKFVEVGIDKNKLKELSKLYDNIYKKIFLKL